MKHHTPVLLNETINYLITDLSGVYFEGTVGFGGHSTKILESIDSTARFIGTDKDIIAYEYCKNKFGNDSRVKLFNTSFTDIKNISKIEFIEKFDGIFVDLGVSSYQLDDKKSGFTFREDTILDLRMDKSKGKPAFQVINNYEEKAIANIIYQFGEEKRSRQIARKIVEERKMKKIKSSFQLNEIIKSCVNSRYYSKSLARVFQAFRIYVNNELDELKEFIEISIDQLKVGGRIAVITFHSLEDRIVKEMFKYETLKCVCPPEFPVCNCDKQQRLKLITKKPVVPSDEEIRINRRSRSAKLRIAERI